jgi:hypothetical protein
VDQGVEVGEDLNGRAVQNDLSSGRDPGDPVMKYAVCQSAWEGMQKTWTKTRTSQLLGLFPRVVCVSVYLGNKCSQLRFPLLRS